MKKTALFNTRVISLALFGSLLFAFTACKTTKTVSSLKQIAQNPVVKVIELVQKNQPNFKTANINKMSLALEMGERKVNVSATVKLKTDSVIYLSIQPFLGIEMFKAEFTTDTIRIYDKMNRRSYVSDYSYFRNRFGVDVGFLNLQAMLTARFFAVGNKTNFTDSCKLISRPDGINRIENRTKNIVQTTDISAQNLIQQVILQSASGNYQIQTTYSDYQVSNGINFPQKMQLILSGQNNKASCDFNIVSASFNTDLNFVPTNPEKFTRSGLDQLLKK